MCHVGDLLKAFFRELPDCLLCSALFDKWLSVLPCAPQLFIFNLDFSDGENPPVEKSIELFRELIEHLPFENRHLLERLMWLLHQAPFRYFAFLILSRFQLIKLVHV